MRQHGGVASTCIHGFAPGTCLICQTLQPGAGTTTKDAGRKGRRVAQPVAPGKTPVRPDAVISPGPPRRSSLGVRALGIFFLAVAVLVAVWVVAGVVLAVLRILELVAVALVAGWIGWRLGVRHGRGMRR
jgi:hypothetical protein